MFISISAHVPFNERDVHHYHCTKELDLSPAKCPIKMTSLEETCFINFDCEIEPEDLGSQLFSSSDWLMCFNGTATDP